MEPHLRVMNLSTVVAIFNTITPELFEVFLACILFAHVCKEWCLCYSSKAALAPVAPLPLMKSVQDAHFVPSDSLDDDIGYGFDVTSATIVHQAFLKRYFLYLLWNNSFVRRKLAPRCSPVTSPVPLVLPEWKVEKAFYCSSFSLGAWLYVMSISGSS